jgi:hypothetical protein
MLGTILFELVRVIAILASVGYILASRPTA